MLAVEALMPERPDFVLSGINHGQNMGEDVLYSGTVAAAMEGLSLGIPSVAISFAGGDLRADVSMLRDQIEPLRDLLKHVISLRAFPEHTLLNVNLPPLRGADIRGVRLTRLGRRVYSGFAQADAGPVGPPDILDRWRLDRVVGRGELRLPRHSGRLHIRDAIAPRLDPSRDARRSGELVAAPLEHELRGPRRRLVELLHDQGIRDLAVLHAIDQTPRHLFVPTGVRHRAYEDSALPIGSGQTISQPSIHARYLELLKLTGNEKVLEIGTGSGYQTALSVAARRAGLLHRAHTRAAGQGTRDDQADRRAEYLLSAWRRYPGLAPVRALRCDTGGRGSAGGAVDLSRAAHRGRTHSDSARRQGRPDAIYVHTSGRTARADGNRSGAIRAARGQIQLGGHVVQQKPQRPFVPHRTPKASRPVTTHSEFRLSRPFVPGLSREEAEATPVQPLAEFVATQRADREQLPPIEVFLDDEVFPGEEESHELPPVEHFLDPLPAVGSFAPDAEGALMDESAVAVDYTSAAETGRPATEAGWGVDDWQQYDWRAAATLGDGVESQASNEWATTDWDAGTRRPRGTS